MKQTTMTCGCKKLLGMIATVAAISVSQTAVAKDKDGKFLIGVAEISNADMRWAFDEAAMRAEAEKQGVSIIFQSANNDPTKQIAQVENMLNQSVDVIILDPVNTATGGAIVDKVQSAGIPVVAYDAGITNAKPEYTVTRDNYQVGVLQAQEALKFAPSGNYAFIKGDPIWQGYDLVVKGYEDTLIGKEGVNIIFDQNANWDPIKAQSLAENALSANQDNLAAIISMNDAMAAAIVQAVVSEGLAGKIFVSGLDANPAALQLIANGAQSMTVYTDLNEFGSTAVKAAAALVKGETLPPSEMIDFGAGDVPTHLISPMAITGDNLCDSLKKLPEGWTTVEEVFGKADACN